METWGDNTNAFETIIKEPSLIIEIGSWEGASAIIMAEIIIKRKLKCKIICVDTWLGSIELLPLKKDVYKNFLENTKEYDIVHIRNTSSIAAQIFKKNKVMADLVYIDGSHNEQDVSVDLENYWPLCKEVLFGDDWKIASVQSAVSLFALEKALKINLLGNVWILDKCTGI